MTQATAMSHLPRADSHAELDELTLRRAQRGDEAACGALVTRYERPVFALLSRMLLPSGRGHAVEDLAQETFLRVFRALPGFVHGGPARLSSWILTIATRLVLDELRRRPFEPPLEPPPAPGPDSALERTQLAVALRAAVGALQPDHRAVFLLREAHGLSYEEIARALDADVGTVKSRLSRARAALRLALSGERP